MFLFFLKLKHKAPGGTHFVLHSIINAGRKDPRTKKDSNEARKRIKSVTLQTTTLTKHMNNTADILELQSQYNDLKHAVDTAWLIQCGIGVFFMQAGFALVEGGNMRTKNIVGVLLKNVIDVAVAAIVFYLWGYGFAFGTSDDPNSFIGTGYFGLKGMEENQVSYAHFFFQFVFCATSTTIVSGACAERVDFGVYLTFSGFVAGWIYPIVVHSIWSTHGWLSAMNDKTMTGGVGAPFRGAYDIAGSGVVHIVGGVCALAACISLGPRSGRFLIGEVNERFPSRNAHMSTLGTFILFFAWFFFNSGSTLALSNGSYLAAARCVTTTLLGGMSGAISCTLCGYLRSGRKTLSLQDGLNGTLGGLVAITAGCGLVPPWAAIISGILSGAVTRFGGEFILYTLKADDPVDAFAVHALNGMLGVLIPGFFASKESIAQVYGILDERFAGVFMGGDGHQLAYQILELVWITVWSAFWSIAVFFGMKKFGGLRIPEEVELAGADIERHEGMMYERTWSTRDVFQMKEDMKTFRIMKHEVAQMKKQLQYLVSAAKTARGQAGGGGHLGGPSDGGIPFLGNGSLGGTPNSSNRGDGVKSCSRAGSVGGDSLAGGGSGHQNNNHHNHGGEAPITIIVPVDTSSSHEPFFQVFEPVATQTPIMIDMTTIAFEDSGASPPSTTTTSQMQQQLELMQTSLGGRLPDRYAQHVKS
ncbi:ammonium transporter, putative [Bodo saltans]|uniref:Ammonium transporter n=1 Tax=Bodo saltans TaxID=75058 RepID=A0A0S4IUJ2_BODSA|nr:ammonium transporter, putative [Bodo saltans]|eukprot:CUG11576.1 ammonium transporter, putative [Bodo saltans]